MRRLDSHNPFVVLVLYFGGHLDSASRRVSKKREGTDEVSVTNLNVHENQIKELVLGHALFHHIVSLLAILRNNDIINVLKLQHTSEHISNATGNGNRRLLTGAQLLGLPGCPQRPRLEVLSLALFPQRQSPVRQAAPLDLS
jgi:hypothetical protein